MNTLFGWITAVLALITILYMGVYNPNHSVPEAVLAGLLYGLTIGFAASCGLSYIFEKGYQ